MADLTIPVDAPATVRDQADRILSRPEFRPPARSLFQRVLDWGSERLGDLVDGLGRAGGPVVGWIVVALILGLIAVVTWRAARSLRTDPTRAGGVAVDGRLRPAADWRAEAARHEASGLWRDAVRCHWRALVADLAARGLVEELPGRTTGEYRGQVARSVPDGASQFAAATGLFEDAWYASVEVEQDDVARCRDLAGHVLAEAGR